MKDNFDNDLLFEDISSSSLPNSRNSLKAMTTNYGNGVFKHLDKIIKAISFIVSIGILLASVAAALLLVKLDKIFAVVSVGILILGIILSAIALFLIYAMGHLISQNNEIIKRL